MKTTQAIDITNAQIVTRLCRLAIEAGINAMRHYHAAGAGAEQKAEQKTDGSPVTLADKEGETLITQGLRALFPHIQIIGEEASATTMPRQIDDIFFLLDPLDGTKEFIQQRTDFTVNIGLIERGTPIFGIVYAPAREELYFTLARRAYMMKLPPHQNALADFNINHASPISTRKPDDDGLIIVASQSHRSAETDDWLARFTVKQLISAGSSLKLCLLASGHADLYPRHGRTMEWDIAAGHAILSCAGGGVVAFSGQPLIYGKRERGLDNPFFLAVADGENISNYL